MNAGLLDPTAVRALARSVGLTPAKHWGQNFVVDANTVRRLVALAGVEAGDAVLEVGSGLGSLTLGLLDVGAQVTAVEIDQRLADLLPRTVEARLPNSAQRLTVVNADALRIASTDTTLGWLSAGGVDGHGSLIANLPYNVAVPVILHIMAEFDRITQGLVMVQLEVARRLTAEPGSRVYGVPSAKLAWFADAQFVGTVPAGVFWPVPNVESGLVRLTRRPAWSTVDREKVFAVVDSAFAQRRKMLRSTLSSLGDTETVRSALEAANVLPTARGETLSIEQFAAIAERL